MDSSTEQFDTAMRSLYERTLSGTNGRYNPHVFNRMVLERGGLQTAKDLLKSDEPQYGLGQLWEYSCLNLSVEFQVLQPQFSALFTDRELERDYELRIDPGGNLIKLDN